MPPPPNKQQAAIEKQQAAKQQAAKQQAVKQQAKQQAGTNGDGQYENRPKTKIRNRIIERLDANFDIKDLVLDDISELVSLSSGKEEKIIEAVRRKLDAGLGAIEIEIRLPRDVKRIPVATKTKIQEKIQTKIKSRILEEINQIIDECMPDYYENNLRNPLKEENERLKDIIGDLKLENFRLKKGVMEV